jgi:hypothetical protein
MQMKKRAQLPDAHTFTTLFRGFSWHPKFPLSVSRALSIYHSMYADNSPVRPSIIHTNAVLKVCALAGDMDALLGVAARLPPRGNAAPNNLTFTTILNAIRSDAFEAEKGERRTPVKVEKQMRAVAQGRKLWEEIRERWARGDIYIDEELVCAMGRLLLISSAEEECDDILSLLEQTMGIPRQVPRMGELGRRVARRNGQMFDVPEDDLPSLEELLPVPQEEISESEDGSLPESDPFALLPHGPPSSQAAVRPGCNTLSLILDACVRVRMVRAAQNYWGLLTDSAGAYKVSPDTENYHMYLRLLRVQRASNLAVALVDDIRQGTLGPRVALQIKTFRIALSCCVRDKKNRNSIAHAAKLVRMMNDALSHPDARALGMYLNLAQSQQPLEWRTLLGVTKDVQRGIANLRSLLAYDLEAGKQHQADLHDLVKVTIGAIDTVLDLGNEDLPQEEKRRLRESRNALQAWLTRMMNRGKSVHEGGGGVKSALRGRENRGMAGSRSNEAGRVSEVVPVEGAGDLVRLVNNPEERRRAARKTKWKKTVDKRVAAAWSRLAEE